MKAQLQRHLGDQIGQSVLALKPLSGGDINQAFRTTFADGATAFVKAHPRLSTDVFTTEARGLNWLRVPGGLVVPEVLHVALEGTRPAFLMLEYLETCAPKAQHQEELGRGLAALHNSLPPPAPSNPAWGWPEDNWIGSLPQHNTPSHNWAEFYWTQRLEPQLARAHDGRRAGPVLAGRFRALERTLKERLPKELPARLHGDLWSGNVLWTRRGPALIDPACYAGSREIDLAMMRLFGGFSERTFAAYEEVQRLPPEASRRCALYQLYPLLVHLNLFGGGYLSSVESALERWGV